MEQRQQDEVDRNYQWFLTRVADLMDKHAGRYALLHDRSLIDIFDTPGEAERHGEAQFPGGPYSIQPIELEPVDLGYFSHARY